MKYVPEGYSIYNNQSTQYWTYTGPENTILNSREFARQAKFNNRDREKEAENIELFEKKPLWELMGKTEMRWRIEHLFIKWRAIIKYNIYG